MTDEDLHLPAAGDAPDVPAPTIAAPVAEEARSLAASLLGWAAGLGAAFSATFTERRAHAQTSDVEILNALLSAEYAAVKAYDAGAGILMEPPAADPLADAAPTVLAVALHFQSQHRDHATELVRRITMDGGTPVDEATVTFTPPAGFTASVLNVIRLAANAEKDAAVAYNQVLAEVDSDTHASLIASIGGVEAQHFIVLSLVAQGVVQATATTGAMAIELTPTGFVVSPSAEFDGLESVPDFTY
jgi:hypothetical protein